MQDPDQKDITKIYNDWAKQYKASTQDFIFPGDMFEYFLEVLPGKKVLDIGCGFWRDVERMRKKWYDASGIEIAEKLIEEASFEIQKYIQLGDMTELEKYYNDRSFDGVFSAASLVHMDKDVAKEVLKKSYNILKEEGCLFLWIKISDTPHMTTKESYSLPWVAKKYAYYTQEEITKILTDLWFKILKTLPHFHKENNWVIIISQK